MKRDGFFQGVMRATTTVLVTVLLLAFTTIVNAAEKKPDDGWQFEITPYIWLPTITGTMWLSFFM